MPWQGEGSEYFRVLCWTIANGRIFMGEGVHKRFASLLAGLLLSAAA